jgi:spermidine synthase
VQDSSAIPLVAAVSTASRSMTRRRVAVALMTASGFAGLGYQIVWTQQGALWLGHEAAAVLAVVAAFFGGLALGASMLGPRIDRSADPVRWYVGCELVIGAWSLVLALLLQPVTGLFLQLVGAQPTPAWHWLVAFLGTFLILLPATAAMGATLPAMERVLASMRDEGAPIATLYAANTFGAVLGVLIAAFALIPGLGLKLTAGVCAALNFACAIAARQLFTDRAVSITAAAAPSRADPVLLALGVTGLLGIGYEVLVVRVLSQITENTVYTFALALAVYLVGTALGASIYGRVSTRKVKPTRDHLLAALSAACVLGVAGLAAAPTIKASMLDLLGPHLLSALAAEVTLAMIAFLPATIVMGALFSHLGTHARASGISFGQALGVNTLGAAAAPFLFGVALLPTVGPKAALLICAAGYLALSSRRAWRGLAHWSVICATAILALWAPSLAFVDVPAGGRLISRNEGVLGTVSIVEDASGVARLHINNRQQEGSSATWLADARQAMLPILLHPSPRRALFLGLGTGITASAASEDPTLQVDAVELLPEVIDSSAYFRRATGTTDDARLHPIAADARRFVRLSEASYDVIVSDNFHPARSGSGSLYTVEHFEAVRDRLAPGGLFCQWLPLHQLDLETLRSIVRSFLAVYPQGWAMLATNSLETPVVGLVAHRDGASFDAGRLHARRLGIATRHRPDEYGIPDDLALLGSFIAGPRALAQFAGDAPLNTDDRPIVAHRAPRITYAPDSLPRDRLVALLGRVEIDPKELLGPSRDDEFAARLSAYWSARNRYIEIGRDVRPASDVRAMLGQVREPLLSVLRISPDFRPAYDPLLRMAVELGRSDIATARALLTELQRLNPDRMDARRALRALADDAR